MRSLLLVASVALIAGPMSAQEWTAEQMEVWDDLVACWDSSVNGTLQACIHDDYVSFQLAQSVPQNKADLVAGEAYSNETFETLWIHRKPLHIDVRGDVALVLYEQNYVSRHTRTGAETTSKESWTEVFVRDGGAWKALTDHGSRAGGE
jgi:hypothetical protein